MQKSSPYKSNAVDLTSAKSEASRFGFAKGQSAVEFAMVIAIFLLLVFAVIDYGWVYFAQLNIQQAVDDGGRFASTGNHTTVSVAGKPTTLSRIASIEAYIQNEISIPNVTVAGNLKVCDVTTNTCGTDGVAGNPEDTGDDDANGQRAGDLDDDALPDSAPLHTLSRWILHLLFEHYLQK